MFLNFKIIHILAGLVHSSQLLDGNDVVEVEAALEVGHCEAFEL